MYSLYTHLHMMQDQARITAYAAAVAATVRPGDVVLDLGAGPGILALLAIRAGAERVYAVELGDVVDLARVVARDNGLADRVVCIQGDSTQIELPERADVLISDIRGTIPVLGNNLLALADARDRLLAPGGRMVPVSDTIFLAPVDCPAGFSLVWGWRDPIAGFDYSSIASVAANQWRREPFDDNALLAPGQAAARLDYRDLQSFDLSMRAEFAVAHAGTCNGVGAWFEAELAPGVIMSTAPCQGETVYGQGYFPLDYAYAVSPGDRIEVAIGAKFVGGKHVWFWTVRVERRGQPPVEERHSSFKGEVVNPAQLRRRAADFVPSLDREGEVERLVLGRMDGETALGEIARELHERFPDRFPTWDDALGRVGEVSARFTK